MNNKNNLIDLSDEENSQDGNINNEDINNEDLLSSNSVGSNNNNLINDQLENIELESLPNESNDSEYEDDSNSEYESSDGENSRDNYEIMLIQRDDIDSEDKEVNKFIKFCIDEKLFDNTFYDYGNAFSIIATKLPVTFEKMSDNGETVDKEIFINFFIKENNYNGDIKYIYEVIEKKSDNLITWEEFIDFFLPFIKYITI